MNEILYSVLSAALFYLGSRALITSWVWRRYPVWLASFADCPACVGFWWGLITALVLGRSLGLSYMGLEPYAWATPIFVGLCSIVTTPIVTGIMQWGLDHTGSAEL